MPVSGLVLVEKVTTSEQLYHCPVSCPTHLLLEHFVRVSIRLSLDKILSLSDQWFVLTQPLRLGQQFHVSLKPRLPPRRVMSSCFFSPPFCMLLPHYLLSDCAALPVFLSSLSSQIGAFDNKFWMGGLEGHQQAQGEGKDQQSRVLKRGSAPR